MKLSGNVTGPEQSFRKARVLDIAGLKQILGYSNTDTKSVSSKRYSVFELHEPTSQTWEKNLTP